MPDESQICRTCLESKCINEMISVFFKSLDEESLATMLKLFTSTKVCFFHSITKFIFLIKTFFNQQVEKNDGLPYFICALCAKNIKISFLFKQQCEDSYEKLLRCMQETSNSEEHTRTSQDVSELPTEFPVNLDNKILSKNVDEVLTKSEIIDVDDDSDCSFTETASSPVEIIEIHEMLHSCDICEKTFETWEQLDVHKREHKRKECRVMAILPHNFTKRRHETASYLRENYFTETPSTRFKLKECRVILNKMPSIPASTAAKETPQQLPQHVRPLTHESRHFDAKAFK